MDGWTIIISFLFGSFLAGAMLVSGSIERNFVQSCHQFKELFAWPAVLAPANS